VSNAAGTTVVDAVATPEDDAEAPPSGS
jgi:hypothetical protein